MAVLCGICGTVKRKIVYTPQDRDPNLITQPTQAYFVCQGCDLTPAPPQHPVDRGGPSGRA